MRVLADLDQHGFEIERRQDVAVGGVARGGERDPIARLEGGKKRQLKGRRGAGRDDDVGGLDRDAVLFAVMAGDRLAQGRDAERVGIADAVFGQGAPCRVEHDFGRRCSGLADFEMDDRVPRRLALIGGAQDVHRDKGRDEPAAGGAERHRPHLGTARRSCQGRAGFAMTGGPHSPQRKPPACLTENRSA